MARLEGYLKDEKRANVIVQLALRELDERDLIAALAGLDDESKRAVYRNLSKKAAESIDAELERLRASLEPAEVEAGLALFNRLISERAGIDVSAY
jgi:flagellar motor switch protein FliG